MVNFDPASDAFARDPYRVYRELRQTHPFYRSDATPGVTYLSRYQHIEDVLRDRRFQRVLSPAESTPSDNQHLSLYDRYIGINLLEMEGAEHDRLRRVISRNFAPVQLKMLKPGIESLVRELIQGVAGKGSMEFIEEVAVPLSVNVISELLGWPATQGHKLRGLSATILRLYEPDASRADAEAAETATEEFVSLMNELIRQRLAEPRQDLLSALLYAETQGEISREEVVASSIMLLNAGHESSVNGAGNGLLALLRHPRQLRLLRADLPLMARAVEEMLRYDGPLQYFHRFATEDLEFHGQHFRRGDKLGLLYGAANRDPDVFPGADEFRVDRYPNRHLAFGRGVHHCIGAPLARMELNLLFTALVQRLPELQLSDENVEFHPGLVFRGVKQLRLRWDAR